MDKVRGGAASVFGRNEVRFNASVEQNLQKIPNQT